MGWDPRLNEKGETALSITGHHSLFPSCGRGVTSCLTLLLHNFCYDGLSLQSLPSPRCVYQICGLSNEKSNQYTKKTLAVLPRVSGTENRVSLLLCSLGSAFCPLTQPSMLTKGRTCLQLSCIVGLLPVSSPGSWRLAWNRGREHICRGGDSNGEIDFVQGADHIHKHIQDPRSQVSYHQKNGATDLESGNELPGAGLQLETPVYSINS